MIVVVITALRKHLSSYWGQLGTTGDAGNQLTDASRERQFRSGGCTARQDGSYARSEPLPGAAASQHSIDLNLGSRDPAIFLKTKHLKHIGLSEKQ
jgi:hypothetical protein